MRVSLDWLKDFIDVRIDLDRLQNLLTMTGLEVTSISETEGDYVMEIEVTPNRPDCLCVLGIARELSAAMPASLKLPLSVRKNFMKKGPTKGTAKIEILDKHGCPRYVGCIMKNVKVGPSPKWLIKRLNSIGVRSVNNVVDITNYVLFELGQPLHAFDLDKLEGKRIIVRRAKKAENIVTIDGINRLLDQNILVIADSKKPVAIAGIMGGKYTEILETTTNILIESAYFDPVVTRRACRQLGLASESSYRFERAVDEAMILAANIRAQELIREIAGGRVGRVTDVGSRITKQRDLSLSLDEVPRVLGLGIEHEEIKDIFKRLRLSPVKKRNKIYVKVPSYRTDLNRDIDLIEEIARLYGYEKIPVRLPSFTAHKAYQLEKKTAILEKEIRRILCSLGLNEVLTYALTSRGTIEGLGMPTEKLVHLKNPLSSQQEVMRPSLLSEILEVLSWNLNRKNTLLQLFELNKVYSMDKNTGQTIEALHLAIAVCGDSRGNWKEKSRDLDFFDLKGVVEMLFDSLGIEDYSIEKMMHPLFKDALSTGININGKCFGILGEVKEDSARIFDIKRRVYVAELFIEDLLGYVNLKKSFMALPRYPFIKRDIALLVDDNISASSIYNIIKEEARGIVKAIDVFDLYRGQQIAEGKKGLAYTIEYRSDERTLNDKEINDIHKKVQDALIKKLGAQIR